MQVIKISVKRTWLSQADDGHLRTAGDEWGGHDGHLAVNVVLNGTGSHNTGNAAARADQHGDEALAGQTELTEDTVHDEGDTSHVADVFKDSQQEEQHQHLRHKAQHRAAAADNTINNQTAQPARTANAVQPRLKVALHDFRNEHIVRPVRQQATNRRHGNVIHKEHDKRENRQRQHAVGHHAVNLVRNAQTALCLALLHRVLHQGVDVGVTLIGDDGLGVVIHFLFAGGDSFLNALLDIFGQLQFRNNLLVALEQLHGVPAQEAGFNLAADEIFNVRQRVFHRAGENAP